MAEFCTCGSLILNGQCTNKNCSLKAHVKSTSGKRSSGGQTKKTAAKTPKTRRASKCIVYNMYDKQEENIT